MTHKAYHYMPKPVWEQMQDDEYMHPYRNLLERWQLGTNPPWTRQKYIFCFLDSPEPKKWLEFETYQVWSSVMHHVRHGEEAVYVSFDILPEDNASVVDWVHMYKVRDALRRIRAIKTRSGDWKIAKPAIDNYVRSRLDVSDYRNHHKLPELIIGNPISLERIVLVD